MPRPHPDNAAPADAAPPDALLLVGHGTRDSRGVEEFLRVADLVAALVPDLVVEPCFLELAEPTIAQGVSRALGRGARRLVVAPVLLFTAGHAKRDIPEAVARALEPHPEVAWRCSRPLECHHHILDLSALRGREALPDDDGHAASTFLLAVGRGSYDPGANSQMARFARLRWERAPVSWLQTCYLAMTEPRLERAVEVVGRLEFERVLVQPHLLFQGQLLARVAEVVETCRRRFPSKRWYLAQHLGAHDLVAHALLDRAGTAAPAPGNPSPAPRVEGPVP